MNVSAIISEYNPMHKGHSYQINKIKNSNDSLVISILGSNFVQRGDLAIMSKSARTKAALSAGADLVIELPVIWSCASAEKFAFGATFIADSMGCINSLNFGSESGNINELKNAALSIDSYETMELTRKLMKTGITFAKARQDAVLDIYGNGTATLLKKPNNILAIEYIRSLNKLKSNIVPETIKRFGAGHDSDVIKDGFCSASYIRKLIMNNDNKFYNYLSEDVANIIKEEIKAKAFPASIKKLETAILYKLRSMSREEILNLPDISEGLQNRIYSAIKTSTSLEELREKIKSKRYTMSRINRIIISAFLGITKEISEYSPQYIRILGFNNNGLKILKEAKYSCKLPIVTKYSDIKNLNYKANRIFDIESISSDLYYLSTPDIKVCDYEKTFKIIKYNLV